MNILFVIANLGVGGAQSFLLRMLSAFPEGHNVYLYDVHPKQKEPEILSNLTREIKIFSSAYERLELFLQGYPKIFTKIMNRLNRYFAIRNKLDKWYFNSILKKKDIQIINSHMYLADSFVYNNCKPNIPKISSFHGCYNLIWKQNNDDEGFANIKNDIQTILNSLSGVITAARRHNEVFKNYGIDKNLTVKKIYYGFPKQNVRNINLKQQYGLPDYAFIFGMLARGDKTKGWQEAIDAFELLRKENNNIYLILSGGTDYLSELKIKYEQNTNIIFTGNISSPLNYISDYDLGLLPTYFPAESLPNTVIEYLYCGKPVVATNWAEIPQMIKFAGESAGEIISLKNGKADVEKLYLAMKSYIEKPEKLKKHSILAKKAFAKFEMQKCIGSYIDFFENMLKQNPQSFKY